jgi:curved DNA-binding protein CbpA
MAAQDYYSVLGVGQSATAEEIRKAYRGRCKTLHPDVNKSPDATRIMQEVNEAYRVLNDLYLRLQYDKEHFSTTTATEDPYPDWDDCCDAHSESDSYVYSNWHRYSSPDNWYHFSSDKTNDVPWWIIAPAIAIFAQLLNNIL